MQFADPVFGCASVRGRREIDSEHSLPTRTRVRMDYPERLVVEFDVPQGGN
jgi:hypothetical protein